MTDTPKRGRGRPTKSPEEKSRRTNITLPPDLAERWKRTPSKDRLRLLDEGLVR